MKPHLQIMPALDGGALAALRASIQRHGVLVPVIRDQHGRIIDGHHRAQLADELGVDYPVEVAEVTGDGHAYELAGTLNLARRHLGTDQRRTLAADLRADGHSLRNIAKALGVSEALIRKDTSGAYECAPDTVLGIDGKTYPHPSTFEVPDDEVREPGRLDGMFTSGTDEWSTPPALFELLDAEFGFDLDVCATAANATCKRFYGRDDDGLAQDWRGTCWMNPPYGAEIGEWMAKAHLEAGGGTTVVCLVPARTDTAWWWDHARHGEVRFIRGRLRFGDAGAAPFPNAVVVFGRRARVIWWEAWP